MFGIGLPELILIMIVALLVVGPKKLPELARSLGKALHQVKSMTDDVKQTFEEDLAKDDNPGQDTNEASGEDETHATEAEVEARPDETHIPGEEKPVEDQAVAESEEKTGSVENPPDTYSNLRG
jgi:Tat protein translocase TatB subunit